MYYRILTRLGGSIICLISVAGCVQIKSDRLYSSADRYGTLKQHRETLSRRLVSPDAVPQAFESPDELDFKKIINLANFGHLYRAIHTKGMTEHLESLLTARNFKHRALAHILIYMIGDESREKHVRESYEKLTGQLKAIEDRYPPNGMLPEALPMTSIAEPALAGLALRYRLQLDVFRDALRIKGRPKSVSKGKSDVAELCRQKVADLIITGLWQDLPLKLAIEFRSDADEQVRRGASRLVSGRAGLTVNGAPAYWYDKHYKWPDDLERRKQLHRIGGPAPYVDFGSLNPWTYKDAIRERLLTAKTHEERRRLDLEYDYFLGMDSMWDLGLEYLGKQLDPNRVRRIVGVKLKVRKLLNEMWLWDRLASYYNLINRDPEKCSAYGTKSSNAKHKVLKIDPGKTGWLLHMKEGLAYLKEVELQLSGKKEPIIETYADLWELSSFSLAWNNMLKAKTKKDLEFWDHRDFSGTHSLYEWDKVRRQAMHADTDREYYFIVRNKVIESLVQRKTTPKALGEELALRYLCREYYRELTHRKDYYERKHRVEAGLSWTEEDEARWRRMGSISTAIRDREFYMLQDLREPGLKYLEYVKDALSGKGKLQLTALPYEKDNSGELSIDSIREHSVESRHLDRYCRIAAVASALLESENHKTAIETHFSFCIDHSKRRTFYLPSKYNLEIQTAYPAVMKRFKEYREEYLKRQRPKVKDD